MGALVFILNTWVRLKSLTLYFSIFLLHLELSISTFNLIKSLGYSTSFSNLQVYEHSPELKSIDFILADCLICWSMRGYENSGVIIVILLLLIMLMFPLVFKSLLVLLIFGHWIIVPFIDSMAATKLYLILKVFKMSGFFGSGVLKHRWLWGNHSGRFNVNG